MCENLRQKELKRRLMAAIPAGAVLIPAMPGKDVTVTEPQDVHESKIPPAGGLQAKAAFMIQYDDGSSDIVAIF